MTRTEIRRAASTIVAGAAVAVGSQMAFTGAAAQRTGVPAAAAQGAAPTGTATQSRVTKAQFDGWMTTLSNWGRWGKLDERGTLNLITPEKRRQAAALAREGVVVSLARPMVSERPADPAGARPVNRQGAESSHFLIDGDYLFERQEIEYHGNRLSHFDALCHVSYGGRLYNGLNFKEVVTPAGGCSKLAVTTAQEGIVTRGVLVDLPGTRVGPAEMAAWEKRTGIRVSPGDVLLLRTARPGGAPASFGTAGYEPSIIPFLKERDVALIGSDIAQEGGTIPGVAIPIHTFTIVALGMNLLDNLALDDLAAAADRLKRWEFMLVVGPLRVQNGAGSPVNPVAIF